MEPIENVEKEVAAEDSPETPVETSEEVESEGE